jgi:hypothetical protein
MHSCPPFVPARTVHEKLLLKSAKIISGYILSKNRCLPACEAAYIKQDYKGLFL